MCWTRRTILIHMVCAIKHIYWTIIRNQFYSRTVLINKLRSLISSVMQSVQVINRLILLTTGLYVVRGNTLLSPSPAIAADGERFTLTCSYNGSETVNGFVWLLNQTTLAVILVPTCEPFDNPGPPDPSLYEYTCSGIKSSNFTVQQISNGNNRDTWLCAATASSFQGYRFSNNVTVTVQVAVKTVSLTPPQTLTESVESLFMCETSAARPAAAVSWYKESSSGQKQEITYQISETYMEEGSLKKTISKLKFTPSRNDNGRKIYCKAKNMPGHTPAMSADFTLIVHYSPDSPPQIQRYSNTYKIIENQQGSLSCIIQGGNPLAALTWDCYNAKSAEVIAGTDVTKTVTWTALRDQDGNCTCQSSHPVAGTQSDSVTVQILYPPTTPVFYIKSTRVPKTITVIKNNSVSISCNSTGNPNLLNYTWTANSAPISGSVLKIDRVLDIGQYTCNVQNSMDPSDGNAELGKNSSFIDIEVLYPPKVGNLQNKSIAEGMSLTVTCPVTPGIPPDTSYKWNRSRDDKEWTTQDLFISNVSRNDAMFYTCEVSNSMKQTGEEQATAIADSKHIYLNVWYGATVIDFHVSGFAGRTNVTVNESGNVHLKCNVDSNPGSNMTVQYLTEGKHSKSDTDTKSLEYVINAATCLDAGIYTCTGSNRYNIKMSLKQLRLFVNCSPRRSPFIQLVENVTSAQHEEAVITFTTLAYPEPTENDFKWFRWDKVQWTSLTNNIAYQIDTGGLQSNLTVKDVNRTSYGKYKLTVKNAIGDYEHIFYLVPAGKPEEPTDLQHVQDLVTETSFTVQWKPGFNNGLEQVFILKYRKAYNREWNIVEIPDTGKLIMKYTVSGVLSGTNYDVVIYASNNLGNSSESPILSVTTKASEDTTDIGPLIGGSVGGSVALALLVVLGFLLIRKFRLSKGKSHSDVELNRRQMVDQDDDSSEDEVITENAMYESAGGVVRKTLVDNSVYAKPQKKVKANQDVYAVVSKGKKHGRKEQRKDKSTTKDQGDIYENAPDVSASKGKTYSNNAYDDSPYEDANTATPSKHAKKNADGLIYADLAFNDQPKGQKKLVIHGLDSMTEYVEVDFTKKAEPLPDSDTEDQK